MGVDLRLGSFSLPLAVSFALLAVPASAFRCPSASFTWQGACRARLSTSLHINRGSLALHGRIRPWQRCGGASARKPACMATKVCVHLHLQASQGMRVRLIGAALSMLQATLSNNPVDPFRAPRTRPWKTGPIGWALSGQWRLLRGPLGAVSRPSCLVVADLL